jgi:Leucine-rich repeat (LRR) protein
MKAKGCNVIAGSLRAELAGDVAPIKNATELDYSRLPLGNVDALFDQVQLGFLTRLNLSGTLIQVIPESIGNCSALTDLDLADCIELNRFPAALSALCNLGKLNLSGCKKLVSLPDVEVRPVVCTLIRLADLNIGRTNITSLPSAIETLMSLRALDLGGCKQLKELPTSVGKLQNLRILNLSGCMELSGLPPEVGNLQNLQELNMNYCQTVKNLPDAVGCLRNLQVLILYNCKKLESIPGSVGDLWNLETLNLDHCKKVTSLPDSLGKLLNLKTLVLGRSLVSYPFVLGKMKAMGCHVTAGATLAELIGDIAMVQDVTSLDYSGLPLTGLPENPGGLEHLHGLLRTLNLNNCGSLASLPGSIGACSSLTSLNLRYCVKLEGLPDAMSSCQALTELDLTRSGIREFPEVITKLIQLTKLDLRGTSIENLPPTAKHLTNLQHLDLGLCKELREVPEVIGQFHKLAFLSIAGTPIVTLPASIGLLCSSLKDLDLMGCREMAVFPDVITNLTLLDRLDISHTALHRQTSGKQEHTHKLQAQIPHCGINW